MIPFILKSTVSLTLLYLFHLLVLEKENIAGFKRYYLLISLVFAMIVPCLHLPVAFLRAGVDGASNLEYQKGYYIIKQITGQVAHTITIKQILFGIYFLITGVLLIRFIVNLSMMVNIAKRASFLRNTHIKIYLTSLQVPPFTFFNRIYFNESEYNNGMVSRELILHEMAHARQKHSIDIVFVELIQIFFWFNPLVYLFKNAIRLNHEYLADEAVIKSTSDLYLYQHQLIHITFRNSSTSLASCFNCSLTKKRLFMMNRQASKRIAAIKKTAAVLLFLTTGILVVLAQDPPPPPPPPAPISGQSVVPPPPPPPASDKIAVSPQSPTPPPPPPPPPPVGQNMSDGSEWWMKILIKHHVTPRAYNNFQNIFEMGKTNSISNDIVTLEDAWMIINMPDTYMVIESPLIFHDLVKNTIRGNEASVKVYYHGTSDLTPISTLDLKDFSMEVEKNGVPSDKTKLKADSVEFLQ